MNNSVEDFVQIDFISDRHTLSIILHADGLSVGAWHMIVNTLDSHEILSGYDSFNAKPTTFSYDKRAFHAIRVHHVWEGWLDKYNAIQESKVNAKDSVTV